MYEINKQMKLYYTGVGKKTKVCPYTQGNTSSFFCYCPYTQGNTVPCVVYYHTHRVIQLHFAVISIPPGEYSFIYLLLFIHNRQMELYRPVCKESNRQMKLYSPGCKDNNRQMKLYYPVCMDNNRQMQLPYTQGNTASFVCYFPCPQRTQLNLFVIFHTHGSTAWCVCYFPYTQGKTSSLDVWKIAEKLSCITCVYGQ
jgi:hypothetical protein